VKTLLATLTAAPLLKLQTILRQVFVLKRKAWLYGICAYLLMTALNVLLALLLPVPAPLAADPALRWQLQQTNASLSEVSVAIDKLAERKALFER
jgi:hypothetical protein